ncbi:MAG: ATP-binding protein [Sulfurospirillum sp.]
MNKSQYSDLKNIFLDGEVFDYVNLDKSSIAYDKLIQAINKPLKLILFYGKPGTGKTFLLQKIYNDFKKKKNIIFLPRPFFDEIEFLKVLYKKSFKETAPKFSGYDEFLSIVTKKLDKNRVATTVLMDESQLYPGDLIEKIRLMADSRKFKFLFTVHKTDEEDILAKDYFKTRIWESIELENSNYIEVKTYIEKKLIFHNKFEYLSLFKEKHLKMIMKLTKGNLRTINKLLFKLFEILEYYDTSNPSKINQRSLQIKYLEMAGISQGMIDA